MFPNKTSSPEHSVEAFVSVIDAETSLLHLKVPFPKKYTKPHNMKNVQFMDILVKKEDRTTYPDMQKYDNEIAYVECGESFSPPAPSEDYQSVIYSDDYGATWRVIQTQIQNTDLAEDTILTGTVIIETELTEPQVWPM